MRKPTILQPEFPYNVGARCINKEWFNIPMDVVWDIMSAQLFFIHHAFKVEILAFVLMSNHFHLILRTPLSNISEVMGWFMRETSRALTRSGNRINQTYGGRHFKSIMMSHNYYLNAYKYLYHNPIHAGLCDNVLDYRYSTLPALLGRQRSVIPVKEDLTLFSDVSGTLDWLNRKPSEENWKAVDRAIHRKIFNFPRVESCPHPLEIDTL